MSATAIKFDEVEVIAKSARGHTFGRHHFTPRGRAAVWESHTKVVRKSNGEERDKYQFEADFYNGLDDIEKAEVNLAVLGAGNGLLEPDFRDRFVNLVADEAIVLGHTQRETMASFEKKLNRMEAAGRILRFTGDDGQLNPDQNQTMNFLSTTLRVAKFRGAVPITWDSMLDAITGDPTVFQDQILRQMAIQVAQDMEENLNFGDLASVNHDLTAFNGVVVGASANPIQAIGTSITTADIVAMLNAMPDRFAQDVDKLRLFMGRRTNLQYSSFLDGRATDAGDAALRSANLGQIKDIPDIVKASRWPYNRGVGSNETNVVLCAPSNMKVGVWRNIEFMIDVDIGGETNVIYVTVRWAFAYEEPRATVRLDGLLDPNT